ncbi:MAG: sugar phosphate nucleotidyltransferase, partial [bacterium]
HRANNADATIVTKVLPNDRLSPRFGYVEADAAGQVSNFVEKPSSPIGKRVSTGIVLFSAPLLVRLLSDNAKRVDTTHNLSQDIVQGLPGRYRVFAHDIEDEWEYLESVYDYFAFQQSLLPNPESNILARMQLMTNLKDRGLDERAPIEFADECSVENSLISPGCVIRGTVRDSILSPGVVVEKGARVENTILFHDAVVRSEAQLQYVIADKESVFEPGCRVGGILESERPRAKMWPMRNALTLIGKNCRVGKGVVIDADKQLAPGEEVLEPSSASILEPMEVSG